MLNRFSMWLFAMLMMLFSCFARATGGTDYSGLTGQIDWAPTIAAILLVMGGLAGLDIVITGGKTILRVLRGGR